MKKSIFCMLLAMTILLSSTLTQAAIGLQTIELDEGGGGSLYFSAGSDYDFSDISYQFVYLMGGENNVVIDLKNTGDAAYAYYSVLRKDEIGNIFNLTLGDVIEDPLGWLFDINSYTVLRYNIRTDEVEVFFNVPNVQQLILNFTLNEIEQGYSGSPYSVEDTEKLIKVGSNSDRPESGMTRYGFDIPSYVYGGEYPMIYMDSDGIIPSGGEIIRKTAASIALKFLESYFPQAKDALRVVGVGLFAAGVLLMLSNPVTATICVVCALIAFFIADANDALHVNLANPPKEENYNSMKYLNNNYESDAHSQRLYNFITAYWQDYVINNIVYEYDENDDECELLQLLQNYKAYKDCVDESGQPDADAFEDWKEANRDRINVAITYMQEAEGEDASKEGYKGRVANKEVSFYDNYMLIDESIRNLDYETKMNYYDSMAQLYHDNYYDVVQQIADKQTERQEVIDEYNKALKEWEDLGDSHTPPPVYPREKITQLDNEISQLRWKSREYWIKYTDYLDDYRELENILNQYAEMGYDLNNPPSEPSAETKELSDIYLTKQAEATESLEKYELGFKELQKLIYKDTGYDGDDKEFKDYVSSAKDKGNFQLFQYLWIHPDDLEKIENGEEVEEPQAITGYDLLFGTDNLWVYCKSTEKGPADENYAYTVLNAIETICGEDEEKYSAVVNSIISNIILSAEKRGETISYNEETAERTMPFDITTLTDKERRIIGVSDPRVEIYKDTVWGSLVTSGKLTLPDFRLTEPLVSLSGRISELTVFINGIITLDTFDELNLSPVDLWDSTLLRIIMLFFILYIVFRILADVFRYLRARQIKLSTIFRKIGLAVIVCGILTAFAINPELTWATTKRAISVVGNVGEEIVGVASSTVYELKGDDKDPSIVYWITYFDVWTHYNTNHNLIDEENRIPRVIGMKYNEVDKNTRGAEGYTWLYGLSEINGTIPTLGESKILQRSWSVMLAEGFLQTGNKQEISHSVYRVVDNFLCPIVKTRMSEETTLGTGLLRDNWVDRYGFATGKKAKDSDLVKSHKFAVGVWQNPNYNGLYQGNFAFNKLLNIVLLLLIVIIKLLAFCFFWYKLYTYIFSILLSVAGDGNVWRVTKETFTPLLHTMVISLWATLVFYMSLTTNGLWGIAVTLFLYFASYKLLLWYASLDSFPTTLKPIRWILCRKKTNVSTVQEADDDEETSVTIDTPKTIEVSRGVFVNNYLTGSAESIEAQVLLLDLYVSKAFDLDLIYKYIKLNVVDKYKRCLGAYVVLPPRQGRIREHIENTYPITIECNLTTGTERLTMNVIIVSNTDFLNNHRDDLNNAYNS